MWKKYPYWGNRKEDYILVHLGGSLVLVSPKPASVKAMRIFIGQRFTGSKWRGGALKGTRNGTVILLSTYCPIAAA